MTDQPAKPSRHHVWRIIRRTISKSWDDSIFSESAQAGFWSVLSLPPLLLALDEIGNLAPLPSLPMRLRASSRTRRP